MEAQPVNYAFKEPVVTINFGNGTVSDLNSGMLYNYRRVVRDCPTDGHYAYTSYSSDCFSKDWITLTEDHTPGDANGNMMIVNASPASGIFLTTKIAGLKGGATYEFSVWMLNVCKPTDKCPFPLLPNITALLQRPDGKVVTELGTGELVRHIEPQWTRYQVIFTTTPSETDLILTMIDSAPGGCGNDFALDDISIRERVIIPPVVTSKPKTPATVKKLPPAPKPVPKKEGPTLVKKQPPATEKVTPHQPQISQNNKPKAPRIVEKATPKQPPESQTDKPQPSQVNQIPKPQTDLPLDSNTVLKPRPPVLPPAPSIVAARANPLIKHIEVEASEIRLDLYDNGQVDGDTNSVYHNNVLLVGHARLSEKAITFQIKVDAAHPHHEFIMVAHNLGSIPPNTSLMVVTAGTKRYEVFISSNEQKNGKVVVDLKE